MSVKPEVLAGCPFLYNKIMDRERRTDGACSNGIRFCATAKHIGGCAPYQMILVSRSQWTGFPNSQENEITLVVYT